MGDFTVCDAFVSAREGGYQDDAGDPGNFLNGALIGTNRGISAPLLAEWWGVSTLTPALMQALTAEEAVQIRQAWYWGPVAGDSLPPGLDLMLYDDAVNRGVPAAATLAQAAAGVTLDGDIGPESLAAFNAGVLPIVARMAEMQISDYRRDKNFATFGLGWMRRVSARFAAAMERVQG